MSYQEITRRDFLRKALLKEKPGAKTLKTPPRQDGCPPETTAFVVQEGQNGAVEICQGITGDEWSRPCVRDLTLLNGTRAAETVPQPGEIVCAPNTLFEQSEAAPTLFPTPTPHPEQYAQAQVEEEKTFLDRLPVIGTVALATTAIFSLIAWRRSRMRQIKEIEARRQGQLRQERARRQRPKRPPEYRPSKAALKAAAQDGGYKGSTDRIFLDAETGEIKTWDNFNGGHIRGTDVFVQPASGGGVATADKGTLFNRKGQEVTTEVQDPISGRRYATPGRGSLDRSAKDKKNIYEIQS